MGNLFSGRKKWLALAVVALLVLLTLFLDANGLLYQLLFHLKEMMADSNRLRDRILAYGPLAPLLYIGLQILQVIVAPIPGEASGFLGGYIFGGWEAFVYSTIGLTIGSGIAFAIARLLGDPVRRRFHQSRVYHRINRLIYKNTFVVPFILFLFPGFPKDSLSYILGLSMMPWRVFLFIAGVGRIPGTLLLSFQGAQVYEKDYLTLALLLLLSVGVSLPCYLYRRR
ncbi:MAG: TVP38/TMEM64 family protein, partial [Desulfobulbaceae bacterium]|nr:TVP38/TMEM64 family protein [Desulfobulbaceae bacterium]